MLAPKRVLHRKVQRGSMKGQAKGNTELHFGKWGLVALERHWITNRQIEAGRVAIVRRMKRGGKIWITIFPDKPISKKPAETRMGKGKGNPLRLAQYKMPIKTKIITRAEQDVEE